MTSPERKPLPNTQPDSAEPPASGLPPSESLDLGQPEVVAATELDRLLTAAVTRHDYLAHSLEQALNDGFDWQKIQALQQQQRRATTLLLHTLNRVVPPRFHDFVLARATRNEQLSYAYVDSLDPKEHRYQLQEAVTIFLTQYQAALQLYEQPQAADATDSRPRLEASVATLEYALKFLSLVGLGVIPIQVDVLPMVKGVCGFVRGSHDITYSAGTLEQPDKSVATTIHELIHLAFQTTDYNSTFYGLLLLANKQLAARYH